MTARDTRAVAQLLECIDHSVDTVLGVDERDSRDKATSAGSDIRLAVATGLGAARA